METFLQMGSKVVWMPTLHARNQVEYANATHIPSQKSIRLFDEDEQLKSEVFEILDLVKQYDAAIATGHISMGESIALCQAARERDVRTILTHPDWAGTFIPVEVQKRLAKMGVIIEKLWFDVGLNHITADYMAQTMRDLGVENCFLSTDRGQVGAEYPVEGLMMFIDALLDAGLTYDEIFTMTHVTPRKVLGMAAKEE